MRTGHRGGSRPARIALHRRGRLRGWLEHAGRDKGVLVTPTAAASESRLCSKKVASPFSSRLSRSLVVRIFRSWAILAIDDKTTSEFWSESAGSGFESHGDHHCPQVGRRSAPRLGRQVFIYFAGSDLRTCDAWCSAPSESRSCTCGRGDGMPCLG